MWGSSFAEFAEKARKQAEELTTQLPSAVVSDGLSSYGVKNLFNLDSIQQSNDDIQNEQQRKQLNEKLSSEIIEFGNEEEVVVDDDVDVSNNESILNDEVDGVDDNCVNVADQLNGDLPVEKEAVLEDEEINNEKESEENVNNDIVVESMTDGFEEDGWEDDDIPIDDDESPEENDTTEKEEVQSIASGPMDDVSSKDNVWNLASTPQKALTSKNKIDEIEETVNEQEKEEINNEIGVNQSTPTENNTIDKTQDSEPTKEVITPAETKPSPPTTLIRPNKKPIDATPPHMVTKFMQQIQRITEHHKTEMSALEQKLQEKEELLRQYQEQQPSQSSDKFKELQKQEEYYKKLIKEQKDKLDEERSQNTVLKTSLMQLQEKHQNFTISVKEEMENQRIEFKGIIQRLEKELSTSQNAEKEVKDKLEILDIESSEKEEIFKNKCMEYEKIIKSKNVQLEEERTKVGMFQSNLDTLLEKEKDNETTSVQDRIKIQNLETELSKFQMELDNQMRTTQSLQENLTKTEEEKTKSQEQYESLKARVKVVATELKERRQENRDLKSANSNLSAELVLLKDEKEKLSTELQNSKSSSTDKEQQSEEYQLRIKELEEELEEIKKKYLDAEAVGNVALQQYKKKAQAALANANARAASANQTKEEMEVEVRSLKAAAEEAEAERKEAIRERVEGINKVTADFRKLDETYQSTAAELKELSQKFRELSVEKDNLEQGLQDSINEQHRLYDEIQKLSDEITKQKEIVDSYSMELDQEKSITRDLTLSLRNLKEQHERSAAAAFLAKQKESGMEDSSADHAAGIAVDTKHVIVQNEGMVNMLQEELDGANEAIKELKRELRDALNREERGESMRPNAVSLPDHASKSDKHENNTSSTPLFYAIEKQAELKIARDEINRLANLVSELETLKQAAWEEKEDMRKKMEEAEARLRRHEKLGTSSVATRSTPTTSRASPYGAYKPTPPKPESSENLNLEYLKNITLRYIKASTVSERKALIPVIAAVLCLTEDETQNAIQAVDSSGLGNVGSALLESTKYFLS